MRKLKRTVLLMLSLVFAVSLSTALVVTGAAENVPADNRSAVFIANDTATGGNWEGNYGKNGYVVFSGAQSVYSDLYTDKSATESIALKGWSNTVSNWLTVDGTNSGLKESSPIDNWTFTGRAWKVLTGGAVLYAPGTTTASNGGVYPWNNVKADGVKMLDSSIAISKTCEADINFTLFYTGIPDNIANVSGKNIKVAVYAGANLAKNDEGVSFYGTELASKTVYGGTDDFRINNYFTFTLSGKGEFQIVLMDASTVAQNSDLKIGGFFIDEVISENRQAEFIGEASGYGTAWQTTPYGADGKVIFTSDGTADNGVKIYSDIYGVDLSTRIAMTGWAANATNTYLVPDADTGAALNSPIIDKWAFTGRAWKVGSVKESVALDLPDGTKQILRTDGFNNALQDSSLVISKTSDAAVYLTTFISASNYLNINESSPIDLYVFRNAVLTNNTVGNINHYSSLDVLCKTTLNSAGTYVTFKLEGTGVFQIVTTRGINQNGDPIGDGKTTPYITGFFLDNSQPIIDGATVHGSSLTLDGDIGLNFYAKIPSSNGNMKMRFTYADGSSEDKPLPARTDFLYKFTAIIAPKAYKDAVKAQLFDGSEAVTQEYSLSVEKFCNTVHGDTDGKYSEKLVDLCKSLLDYCMSANAYLNSLEAPDLNIGAVTASDLESYKLVATGIVPEGLTMLGVSLILESKTTLRIYYSQVEGASIAVKLGDKDLIPVADGDRYYVDVIVNIGAPDLGKKHTVTFGETYNVELSALSYAYSALNLYENSAEKTNLVLLCKSLYLYNLAAVAYFA